MLIDLDENSDKIVIKNNEEQSFCSINQYSKNSVIGSNKYLNSLFLDLINNDKIFKGLNFIEKAVALSLLQTNTRPDASSPTAQFQSMIKYNGKIEYLYTTSTNGGAPFYKGLEILLKKYKSRYSLLSIARLLDRKVNSSIPINRDFAHFLKENKDNLAKIKSYKKSFFKADQIIQSGESVSKLNFSKVVKLYKRNKKPITTTDHLFKIKANNNIACNFDSRIYSNSIFLLSPEIKLSKNPFGLQDSNGNVFMATTDLITTITEKNSKYALFKASSYQRPTAFCSIQNNNGHELLLSSFRGRDPGQFLFSLINKNVESEKSLYEIEELLKAPRALYLQNPKRLLLESNRARSQTVKTLLKENVPIYHVKSIGEVWLHTNFKIDERTYNSGFVHDPRKKGVLACSK